MLSSLQVLYVIRIYRHIYMLCQCGRIFVYLYRNPSISYLLYVSQVVSSKALPEPVPVPEEIVVDGMVLLEKAEELMKAGEEVATVMRHQAAMLMIEVICLVLSPPCYVLLCLRSPYPALLCLRCLLDTLLLYLLLSTSPFEAPLFVIDTALLHFSLLHSPLHCPYFHAFPTTLSVLFCRSTT